MLSISLIFIVIIIISILAVLVYYMYKGKKEGYNSNPCVVSMPGSIYGLYDKNGNFGIIDYNNSLFKSLNTHGKDTRSDIMYAYDSITEKYRIYGLGDPPPYQTPSLQTNFKTTKRLPEYISIGFDMNKKLWIYDTDGVLFPPMPKNINKEQIYRLNTSTCKYERQ